MDIDWTKSFKKTGITVAQAIVGFLFALPLTAKILALLAHFGIHSTPDQIGAVQAQMILILGGALAGLFELIRSLIKQKFKVSWL